MLILNCVFIKIYSGRYVNLQLEQSNTCLCELCWWVYCCDTFFCVDLKMYIVINNICSFGHHLERLNVTSLTVT